MATSLVWPISTLTPGNIARTFMPSMLSGSQSISGFTQRVGTLSARWMIRYENVAVFSDAQILKWDEMELALNGGAEAVLIPLAEAASRKKLTGVTAGASATAGDVSMQLTVTLGGAPTPGQHFTIGERLHRVLTVGAISSGKWPITFLPRLRENVSNGATVTFQDLQCKCRLASPNGMAATLEALKYFTASVDFIEDPN